MDAMRERDANLTDLVATLRVELLQLSTSDVKKLRLGGAIGIRGGKKKT